MVVLETINKDTILDKEITRLEPKNVKLISVIAAKKGKADPFHIPFKEEAETTNEIKSLKPKKVIAYKKKKETSKSIIQKKEQEAQNKNVVLIDQHISIEIKKKSPSAGSLNYKKIHKLSYVDFAKPKTLKKDDWPECDGENSENFTKEELKQRNSYEYYKKNPKKFSCQLDIRTTRGGKNALFTEKLKETNCTNLITHEECHISCGCANRRLQLGWFAKTQILPAGEKGYGLYAAEDILPGDFITEYIGEVVNRETIDKRFEEAGKKGLRHVYAMHIDGKMYIDSSIKGNEARFINHSCDPNATSHKMTVGNEIRIAIVALRHIKAGEEITFDYMFKSFNGAHVKCFCGSKNCKGYFC